MQINNPNLSQYPFLREMDRDDYFPPHLVAKGKGILRRLCLSIEASNPGLLEALYALTHAATDEFNALGEEFEDEDSELETAARENIANDFGVIAKAYGFEADVEELIAPRDW